MQNCPRQSKTIISRSPTPQFIKNHKTLGCCIIKNIRNLDHLSHESWLIFCNNISASYSSKNPINKSDFCFLCRNIQPTMRKQNNYCTLSEKGWFSSHIGTCNDMDKSAFISLILTNRQRIRDKRLILRQICLYHRMAPSYNCYLLSRIETWSNISFLFSKKSLRSK